jgi:uncharacterized protein
MSSLESVPLQGPPPRRNLFIGDDGLRAGWRAAIFLLMTAGTIWLAFFLAGPFLRRFGQGDPAGMILSESILFLCAIIPTVIMAGIERRPVAVYGLPMREAFRTNFWKGAAWGFVSLTVVMLCLMATRVYSPGGIDLPMRQIVTYGLVWALGFLLVGFAEEYLFRGYLLYTLTLGMGFWPATILLSLLFALAHRGNPGETWAGLFGIVIIAIFFCVTVQRTGSLWFAVGLHMSYDWGESFFYSVPDSGTYIHGHLLHSHLGGPRWLSGGSVGPEGSIFAFLADLAMLFLFLWLYRERRYPQRRPVSATLPEGVSAQ